MADYELALSTGPSVKDLNIVWAPETSLPKIHAAKCKVWRFGKVQNSGRVATEEFGRWFVRASFGREEAAELRKLVQKNVKESAGKNWFNMPAPTITPALKRDLQLLKLRNVIDPKQHYKTNDTKGVPKFFHGPLP